MFDGTFSKNRTLLASMFPRRFRIDSLSRVTSMNNIARSHPRLHADEAKEKTLGLRLLSRKPAVREIWFVYPPWGNWLFIIDQRVPETNYNYFLL